MKTIEKELLFQLSGGMTQSNCATIAMASAVAFSGGLWALSLFGAAIWMGAGCGS